MLGENRENPALRGDKSMAEDCCRNEITSVTTPICRHCKESLPVLAGDDSVGDDVNDWPDAPASLQHFPPRRLYSPQDHFWRLPFQCTCQDSRSMHCLCLLCSRERMAMLMQMLLRREWTQLRQLQYLIYKKQDVLQLSMTLWPRSVLGK